MRKKFESGTGSKYITKKKKEPTKYITKKKGAESKYITRKKKKFDLADLPSLQKKKESKFITKKSPQQIREREMVRSKKMGGGMMGRRFGMKSGSLKPVDPKTQKGLSKLPTEVRNKMGYMKKGGKVK
jgi:thiamine kinase-like enzyme